MIKIYKVTDCDWVASSDPEGAKSEMVKICGEEEANEQIEENGGIHELTKEEMDKHSYCDDEERNISFRSELDIMINDPRIEFPCHFCCSEY